jgi:fatty acid CoA ligase FadD9
VAESVTTIGEQTATATDTSGTYRSFEDVMNPNDDGISLDVFVD